MRGIAVGAGPRLGLTYDAAMPDGGSSEDRFASRWNEADAPAADDPLGLCVYASRLLGQDAALVLAGGGNSSVKLTELDVHGDPVEVLRVKGSGWDMGSIEPEGFAPLRLASVARLAELELQDPAAIRLSHRHGFRLRDDRLRDELDQLRGRHA